MPNRLTASDYDLPTEARAIYYAFRPHADNNTMDKLLTGFLFVVWGAITLGLAFGPVDAPPAAYGGLTAFVWYRVGTIKEREAARLAAEDTS